ncbi:hypothetical protein BC941DRAFT_503890 [Chlamydoabsidia padenii]|nr:hypothetical protein BC941DRAFT_503890 [Chlamydoabsidia padenii]
MKSYCVVLFTLIALATAQSSTSPFYITNPLPGTVLKAGDTIDIEWNNGIDEIAQVTIIQGANSGTMSPTDISFEVEGDEGSHTFKVPKTLSPAGTYAFQFEYTDSNGSTQYAYSGPFSVTGGAGTITSSTAPGTATLAHATSSSSSIVSSPSPLSNISPSASSPSVSGKPSVSASTTPTPNSGSSLSMVTLVLAVPVLLTMALLSA